MSQGIWYGLNAAFFLMNYFLKFSNKKSKSVSECNIYVQCIYSVNLSLGFWSFSISDHRMYALIEIHHFLGLVIAPTLVVTLDLSDLHIFQVPIVYSHSSVQGNHQNWRELNFCL